MKKFLHLGMLLAVFSLFVSAMLGQSKPSQRPPSLPTNIPPPPNFSGGLSKNGKFQICIRTSQWLICYNINFNLSLISLTYLDSFFELFVESARKKYPGLSASAAIRPLFYATGNSSQLIKSEFSVGHWFEVVWRVVSPRCTHHRRIAKGRCRCESTAAVILITGISRH